MEQIKSYFEHDYNLAVQSFNGKDYVSFFRNIRPALEGLGKVILCDILGDDEAQELIDGNTSIAWNKDTNTFKISRTKAHHLPTGREFTGLAFKAYYSTHPNLTTNRYDENKKRLKRELDSCSSSLSRYYSVASELGSHTGGFNMNAETQSMSCATFLNALFDLLKSHHVLSPSIISFIENLEKFIYDNPSVLAEAKHHLSELENQISEKDTALLLAQKQQAESEQKQLEAEQRTAEVEDQLSSLQKKITELKNQIEQNEALHKKMPSQTKTAEDTAPNSPNPVIPTPPIEEVKLYGIAEGIDIDEESMDDDQLDLIEYTNDKSMLVAGCAGSGKSVIAMHKAEQLYSQGQNVILIAYTKSLNEFMKVGKSSASYHFYYHYQWKKLNMPQADYVIVDEIQDFTREEIQEFIQAAKKHFLFFGDTAQSIYGEFGKQTMTIAEIAEMTGLNTLQLFNNYRLPRPVAKITQDYVGVNVQKYKEKVYQNKESDLPHFVPVTDEISSIKQIINSHPQYSIGILCPSNDIVLELYQQMKGQGLSCEYKYNNPEDDKMYNINTLNFQTSLPKILTYHSAKGLQFDVVIIPRFNGAKGDEAKKALYVAMTRTKHKLYVLYMTPELASPLKEVPPYLFVKEI